MASLGSASMSSELLEQIVTAAGKEYNTGSSYQIEFKGPGVKIIEYDEHGVLRDMCMYTPQDDIVIDWSEEQAAINKMKDKNRTKKVAYYCFIAVVVVLVITAYCILQYLK